MDNTIILGAGITGLSAGYYTGYNVYEAEPFAGGICASYYIGLDGEKKYFRENKNSYRFEVGGGHWIFGADEKILNFINKFSKVKSYSRNSAVFFKDKNLYIPYPIQNHLSYLPKQISKKVVKEILNNKKNNINTLKDWLLASFGETLCEIFFFPFHDLYTAGLYTKIAPQDEYKTPVDKKLILRGLEEKTPAVGYNARFVYPKNGLNELINNLEKICKIEYNKKVLNIDLKNKKVSFSDGTIVKYKKLISTLPLNKMALLCNLPIGNNTVEYTSVLVINIGAKKGKECPKYHWLYIPESKTGFHRVGFYSNVDKSFLPSDSKIKNDRVSIYVEKAYKNKIDKKDIKNMVDETIKELKLWEFIKEVEVVDPTFVDVAYTWEYPGSKWKQEILDLLRKNDVISIGRYGKWKFQGIAESINDGREILSII